MPYHDHMHQPHCEFSTRGWEGWWWWCIWSANWTMQSPLSPLELWWRVQEHPVLYWWRVHWTAMVNCARRIMSTVLKVALKSHCTMVKRARRTTSRVLKIALRAFLLYSIHVTSHHLHTTMVTPAAAKSHHTTSTHFTSHHQHTHHITAIFNHHHTQVTSTPHHQHQWYVWNKCDMLLLMWPVW